MGNWPVMAAMAFILSNVSMGMWRLSRSTIMEYELAFRLGSFGTGVPVGGMDFPEIRRIPEFHAPDYRSLDTRCQEL